jgi:predicted nuclease of predicted toxin-antitoxin system
VKFLIDAQLPARLAEFLNRAGHDALHTIGLPDGNRSTDSQIAQHADTENRVVVTKDQDFRDGHLLGRSPRKLLVVATGNITNDASSRSSSSTSTPSSRRSVRPTSSS